MEDFSPQESPEAGISVVEDTGGPERYQFELFSPAAIMPKVKAAPPLVLCPPPTHPPTHYQGTVLHF